MRRKKVQKFRVNDLCGIAVLKINDLDSWHRSCLEANEFL
jgi:hypothetical protein